MELKRAAPETFAAIAEQEAEAFPLPLTEQDLNTLADNDTFRIFTWSDQGDPVGHCVLFRVLDEAEITSFVIRKDRRGQGEGTAFLRALLEWLKSDGAKIAYLDVRRSNLPAQRLYKTCGFTVLGVRKRFYTHPTEDAVSMGLEL